MASYHFSMKAGKRGNASLHAQYICREDKYAKGAKAEELVHKDHGNMPQWAKENPQDFWKAADEYERANGTVYREMELALPNELTIEQQKELVDGFIKEHLADEHTYTYGIHNKKAELSPDNEQPHVHIMFCERKLDGIEREKETFFKRGELKKAEKWNGKNRSEHTKELRKSWAEYQNRSLGKYGHEIRVDHRTKREQQQEALAKGDHEKAKKLDRPVEKHLGPKVANRMVRQVKQHLSQAKTSEERAQKREEYFEKIETSDKAKLVYSIRELKRTEREIERLEKNMSVQRDYDKKITESHNQDQRTTEEKTQGNELTPEETESRSRAKFYDAERDSDRAKITGREGSKIMEARVKEIDQKIDQYRNELKKLEENRPPLEREKVEVVVKSQYVNGKDQELEKQVQEMRKERGEYDKAVKAHEENKPIVDFSGKYKAEAERLAEWRKNLSERWKENKAQRLEIEEKLQTPEAKANIEKRTQEIIQKDIIRMEKIKEAKDQLGQLSKERTETQITKTQFDKAPNHSFEIQGRNDIAQNIVNQKDQIRGQVKANELGKGKSIADDNRNPGGRSR